MNAPDATRTCGDAGGLTKAGTACRCSMNLSPANGRCVMHDNERLAERLAIRSAGGAASKVAKTKAKAADASEVPAAPRTLSDAVAVSSWITHAVLIGEIDVRVAEAATKSVRQFQLSEEKRALEGEIKKLRAELAAARGKAKP